MKTSFTHGVCLFLAITVGMRGMEVTDDQTHALLLKSNLDYLAKMAETFQRLDTQIEKLDGTLQQTTQIARSVGNPTQVGNLISLSALTQSLDQHGVGRLSVDIVQSANGSSSWQNTSGGLYLAVPSSLPSGKPVQRDAQVYKPYAALEDQKQNYDAVARQSDGQVAAIDKEIESTLLQLKTASTDAEVQKLNGKLAALQSARQKWTEQKHAAYEQLNAQKISNDNDAAKQAQARQEEFNQIERDSIRGTTAP